MRLSAVPGPPGTLRGAAPGGSRHRAGTGVGRGRSAPTWRSRRWRGRGCHQPGRGPPRRILRSGVPGLQGGPPPQLGPGASSCSERSPVRWVRREAWGRPPERAAEGEGAAACSSSVPGSGPSPSRRRRRRCRLRLLFSLRRPLLLSRWEGSQRSVSGASGEAGNSAAPARRPAPGLGPAPGPAPRWWKQRRWRGREGITPAIDLYLQRAHGLRAAARSATPAAPGTARWEVNAAGRGPAAAGVGVGVGIPGVAPVSRVP